MDKNVSKNNNILASWIDEFVSNFSKNHKEEITSEIQDNEMNVTAEINIEDLPKVSWNDEVYYVFFDNDGASILNQFGNVVTTFAGIKTLDEVNEKLSEKQITSEVNNSLEINAEMENEINKAYNYIKADANDDEQKAENYINSYPNDQQNNLNQDNSNQDNSNQDNSNQDVNNQQNVYTAMVAELSTMEHLGKVEISNLIDDKLKNFENNLSNMLNEKVASIVEQVYCRMNPGNSYDLSEQIIRNEIQKFTNEVNNTLKQINMENNIDRTTPEGKYTTRNVDENNENELDKLEQMDESNDDKFNIELPDDQQEIFKNGKCPNCDSQLVNLGIKHKHYNIECTGCDIEYKINSDNEKIYIK